MKKILFPTTLLLTALCAQLNGQTGESLTRQLEVTRAYEPTVNEASKLEIKPNLVDTVALTPDMEYTLKAQPLTRGFEVTPLSAATINVSDYRFRTPFYVKVAVGYPLQSLADIYVHSTDMKNGSLGAYINHYGSWSKQENDNGSKLPAAQSFNKIGVLGERYVGRYTLDGELGYDYDMVSRYGYYTHGEAFPTDYDTTAKGLRTTFSTVRGRVSFGDSFDDLSRLNFRIGAQGAYFNDNADYDQFDGGLSLELGKSFGGQHEVTLYAGYDIYRGRYRGATRYNYDSDIATVAPLYHLAAGIFDFSLGADFVYNHLGGGDDPDAEYEKFYFFPRFAMSLDLANGYFAPFVEVDGELWSNDFRTLATENPYFRPAVAPNTAAYNGRVGFTGSFSSAFSYKVYGGASIYKDMLMPAALYIPDQSYGERIGTLRDSATMWTVGLDLEARVSGSFTLNASAQYFTYSGLDFDHVSDASDFTATLGLRYTSRNKWSATLGATFLSTCYYARDSYQAGWAELPTGVSFEKVDPTVDITLGVDYRISQKLGAFVQLNNLANMKLYRFAYYPGLRFNALAGVKVSF